MKIHTRTLLIIGATVLALIVVLAVVAQLFVLSSYTQVEQQESATNVALVTGVLQEETQNLGESIHTWAVSDATYGFVEGRNPDYIHTVIDQPAFQEGLGVDGLLLYNSSGGLVYSRSFDTTGQGSPVTELTAYIAAHQSILPDPNGVKRKQGFVLLPSGPVIVAMHAILPEEGADTPGGTFVVVRSFNAGAVASLQNQVHLPVQIATLDNPEVATSPVAAALLQPSAAAVQNTITNQTTITGSTLVTAIDGKPALLLSVQTPRHMNEQASASLLFILCAFLVVGIIFVVVTELLLRRYILRHLTGLDTTLKEIGDRRDLSERIPVNGDDEIASLKESLNRMLAELAEKEAELAEANRKANLYLDIYLDVLTYEILNATIAYRGYAELIRESEGKDKDVYATRIIDLITRSREVIKNIETISAIYKNPPSRTPVNLGAVLSRVTKDFPGTAIACEGCDITVLADEKLDMVFKNILANSVKYGGANVQVTISARPTENGMTEISVTDTGKGIPDSMKPLIFDRFTKGSDTRSSYGLGLHIVKMLVEAYGGKIRADNRVAGHPEQGAALRFTLFPA